MRFEIKGSDRQDPSIADQLQLNVDVVLDGFEQSSQSVFEILEHNRVCRNLKPKCEPRLGKRGLYDLLGGKRVQDTQLALLWVLNQSDGRHDLLEIAEKSGLGFPTILHAANALLETDLLAEDPRA